MQTFLPFESFIESAQSLDYRRLGKQRTEALQIWRTIVYDLDAWANHPAVNMWRGHTKALLRYYSVVCEEWVNRGYQQHKLPKLSPTHFAGCDVPLWLGDEKFHASHRSNLKRKKPEYYVWEESPDLPYIWPKGK